MILPRIAVLMPVYNEEQTIVKTLKTIINQSIPPTLILIGDNESTDRTAFIAKKFLNTLGFKNYKVIKVNRYPELGKLNIKIVYSVLIKILKKYYHDEIDYIATVEADTYLESTYFEKVIQHFKEDSKLCIAGGVLEPLGLLQDPYPLMIPNTGLWGTGRLYKARCLFKISKIIDTIYLPSWDTDHVILAYILGHHVSQIPEAKAYTTRTPREYRGLPKAIRDSGHNLPLWWVLYKAVKKIDLEYLIHYVVIKVRLIIHFRYRRNRKPLKYVNDIYRNAINKLFITITVKFVVKWFRVISKNISKIL